MHCMPCCNYCDIKYINEDNTINYIAISIVDLKHIMRNDPELEIVLEKFKYFKQFCKNVINNANYDKTTKGIQLYYLLDNMLFEWSLLPYKHEIMLQLISTSKVIYETYKEKLNNV